MSDEVYRVSDATAAYNVEMLRNYVNSNMLSSKEIAQVTGVSVYTINMLLEKRSNGTVHTWQKIAAGARLKLKYDHKLANALPAAKSHEENYLLDVVRKHLIQFGNTCLDDREIRKIGGIKQVVKALHGYGANVEAFKGESGWCVRFPIEQTRRKKE